MKPLISLRARAISLTYTYTHKYTCNIPPAPNSPYGYKVYPWQFICSEHGLELIVVEEPDDGNWCVPPFRCISLKQQLLQGTAHRTRTCARALLSPNQTETRRTPHTILPANISPPFFSFSPARLPLFRKDGRNPPAHRSGHYWCCCRAAVPLVHWRRSRPRCRRGQMPQRQGRQQRQQTTVLDCGRHSEHRGAAV